MFPFGVDPRWYEIYWYTDRPRPNRRSLSGSLARFAVLAVLLTGSGFVLGHFHAHGNAISDQDREHK